MGEPGGLSSMGSHRVGHDWSDLAAAAHSAYKLNKQGDSIEPFCTPFPVLNQPVVPCSVLTVASWLAYIKRQVRWSGIPIFWRIFQFVVIYTVKGFSVVSEVGVGVGVLRHYLAFSMIQTDVGKFISGSSAFSKSSLNIWKFMVHVLLKPGLENFELKPSLKDFKHNLASM